MTDNPFDIFGDIFGKNPNFGDIFGNKKEEPPQTRLEALIKTFEQEVSKGDKKFLKSAVVNYNDYVTKTNDQRLNRVHALASIFIENFSLGHSSLKRYVDATNDPLPNLTEALGLLAYQTQHFQEAIKLIDTDSFCEEAILARMYSQYKTGNTKITTYKNELNRSLKKSIISNTIIGKIYFDKKDFNKASKYFNKAVEIEPKNEEVRLNQFVNFLQLGEFNEVYPKISAFYVETESTKTMEDMNSRLDGREIKVEMYKPTAKMYVIIRGLGI